MILDKIFRKNIFKFVSEKFGDKKIVCNFAS